MNKSYNNDGYSIGKKEVIISLIIIGILYFIFGFVSWVNAILIPYFKIAFQLSHFQSYFVALAFYISYLFLSIPASFLLKKVGFKKGMAVGVWFMAAGAFMFVPAALVKSYPLFLSGLFLIGVGLAINQTAVNPYITILGPKERAAQRISLMGIFNKGAGIIAPLLFAAVILRSTDNELFQQIPLMHPVEKDIVLHDLLKRVIWPYVAVGTGLLLFGFYLLISPLPDINTENESDEVKLANQDKTSIFQFPHLILGAIALFLHVGTQILAIDTIINYADTMGVSLLEAKAFPSYTMTATIVGYCIGIICIPKVFSQLWALRFCTCLGFLLSIAIVFVHGKISIMGHHVDVSIWFLVLLGLANSLVWAGIWPLAIDGLGRFTKIGGSLLIMGLCGNAIMPLIYGHIADLAGARLAYLLLIPCYAYLIFYAYHGYKIRQWTVKRQTTT